MKAASYYTWLDQPYRDFMTQLLRNLHPRRENAGHVILSEMEDSNEIVFACTGSIALGFEINKKRHFYLKLEKW